MVQDLEAAPDGSILLFHVCAHNPTGCDPTEQEWNTLFELVKRKKCLIFFDSAYQGM